MRPENTRDLDQACMHSTMRPVHFGVRGSIAMQGPWGTRTERCWPAMHMYAYGHKNVKLPRGIAIGAQSGDSRYHTAGERPRRAQGPHAASKLNYN